MVDEQPSSAVPGRPVPTSRVFFRPPANWKTMTGEKKIALAREVLAPLFSDREAERPSPQ